MRIGMVRTLGAFGLLVGVSVALPATSTLAAPAAKVQSTPIGALLATLGDPTATAGDSFGYAVAVSGNTAVVGAYGAESAYIYVKGASGWSTTPTATLPDPSVASDEQFGLAVAVSGKTAVVGSRSTGTGPGMAYVYTEGALGWPTTPTATLTDPSAATYQFGFSVAVSGKTIVVGAYGSFRVPGTVYIYVRGTSGWPTMPTMKLNDPKADAGDSFGRSVAVSGTTIVVGSLGPEDDGTVYIYLKGGSGWPKKPTTFLPDPRATRYDDFGDSVSVSGTIAIVGAEGTNSVAGAAYIYEKGTSAWPTTPITTLLDPQATAGDYFGASVSVAGTTAVVGGPQTTNSGDGAGYIYVRGSSGWRTTPTISLSDPDETAHDYFGNSVAVSGRTAVVGAVGTKSQTGAAYIYKA